MAIDIKFDLVGNPEPPTIILANRNGNMLGQLKVNNKTIDLADNLVEPSEFSFTLNKYIDNEITPLWDKVVDFKLVYCKEWDAWFEITVELDEATETVKTVLCTHLGHAELSQLMLYNIEINTEADIERDDYKVSILYDGEDSEASILNRLLKDKAPHYQIAYVSPTIATLQRSFSFDGKSILDAFQEIAEEIGCLFQYYADKDENDVLQRKISVFDLQQCCNDCGYRGEFTDKCPKCNGINITNGYGEDTLIFVTSDELASSGIQFTTDTDSVKNTFKLEAGDDLMTATIRNCNPNGTDYIWYLSDSIKEDMTDELVKRLESYNEMYKEYYGEYVSNIDSKLLTNYNSLVDKYSVYNEDLQKIKSPITGYPSLMNANYSVIDLEFYLKSGLMPSVEMIDTNAQKEVKLLTASSLSPVAVADVSIASLATVNSAILAMAKTVVNPIYKIQIDSSELIDGGNSKSWKGNFIITNYSDDEDTAVGSVISVQISDDLEEFIKQKIEKALNKENTDDLSVSGLFKKEYDDFCAELKKYALNPLVGIHDSCQACIDILIDQGVGNKDSWADDKEGSESNLYEKLYLPYYNKLEAIEAEIKVRENEVNIISGKYDVNGNIVADGIKTNIEKCKIQIQEALNFQNYLGETLWLEFCAYRREDKYLNENYISDGLNNAELFKRALEFFEVAENEIYKSAELQHSISTTLNNLLAIPKFKDLVKYFKVGNWIRVRVDDEIFKLRLLRYEIKYDDFKNIDVKFSDVTKTKNGITDVEDILSQASSMSTSYDSVKKQSAQGGKAQGTISQWISSGLKSALVQIQNNDSEEITLSKNGLLGRSYDDTTDTYSPEQFRLTHNIMAYTKDNWKTVSSALGKHEYTRWENNQWIKDVDYGLSATFVTAGYVAGSQIIGGEIVSSNYKSGESGTYFDLINGDFEIAGGNIIYDTRDKALTLKNVTIEWSSATKPEINDITGLDKYLEQLEDLEDQLDGRAQTWYQDTDPSIEWITDNEKKLHAGDLWHYTGETGIVNNVERIKNSEWIWKEINGKYQWVSIEISDIVFDAIDGKAQIFTAIPPNTPAPPYYVGDLWVQGVNGDILHCIVSKEKGQSYSEDDWELSSKYTDDTLAKEALEKAKKGIADAASAINLANGAKDYTDSEVNNAKNYAVSQDSLLSQNLTNAYKKYTDSEISTLDSAVANYLGLGGSTLIGGSYVISPYIAGGYLNITNTTNNSRVIIDPNNLTGNGYIFQVHNGQKVTIGIDKNGNAAFNGAIVATSLTLGSGVSISSDKIDGLSDIATSGDYNDLKNKPIIPDSAGNLGIDLDSIMYKGDITQTIKTDSNGIEYVETTVPTDDGTIKYSTYNAGDYIVFGRSKGTNANGKNYICISKEGLLTARNALIYGTVYATDGEFTGKITASDGEIAGWNISSDSLSRTYTSGNITRNIFVQAYGDDNSNAFAARHKTGSETNWTYDFYVRNDGYLYANNANIKGKITASSGSIDGDLTVSGSLTHTNGNYTVTLRGVQPTLTNGVFYITDRSSGESKYPFVVKGDGSFSASKANITGDSTFGGTLDAVTGSFDNLTAGASYFSSTYIKIDANGKGNVRIGTPDYLDWEDLTIRPSSNHIGNIGLPNYAWDTLYVRLSGTGSKREIKEDINMYNTELAYEELKTLPIYTYFYKDVSSATNNMSIGTMIDYIPAEAMLTTPNDNDYYNTSSMIFWSIAASQVMQSKLEALISKVEELEAKIN